MSNKEQQQPKVSNAFVLQLKTATHRASSLTEQRNGVLDQLTEIQVLHKLEVEQRQATQAKLEETSQQLIASQEQTMKWLNAANDNATKVAALTWYCEQLLTQLPDSNGMHTIDAGLLNDIVKTHTSVLEGERISTNIADVIRVTALANQPTDNEGGTDEQENAKDEDSQSNQETVVQLDHGLSGEDDAQSTDADDIQIEVEDAVVEKPQSRQEKKKAKKNKQA